jgi:N-acetylglutamate synthase-like GNAT family acetyltransferase
MSSSDSQIQTHRRGEMVISTDRSLVNVDRVHDYLVHSYWAKGIPRKVLERAIQNSLCFGIYDAGRQVGFARVISDFSTYAYLADVFVVDEYRGRGLSRWPLDHPVEHPDLQGLRRWPLATRDAHGLYAKFGFTPLEVPERFMERHDSKVYARAADDLRQ